MLKPGVISTDLSQPPAYHRIRSKQRASRWLLFLFLPVAVFAMELFRFCLFSDVNGRVVMNGQPVVGAVVERSYRIIGDDKTPMDTTMTDARGYFQFKKIWWYTLRAWLPGELNVSQHIWIKHGGMKYEAWRLIKPRPLEPDSELPDEASGEKFDPKTFDSFAEYPKRKIILSCDLADEPSWKEPYLGGSNTLFGICKVVKAL